MIEALKLVPSLKEEDNPEVKLKHFVQEFDGISAYLHNPNYSLSRVSEVGRNDISKKATFLADTIREATFGKRVSPEDPHENHQDDELNLLEEVVWSAAAAVEDKIEGEKIKVKRVTQRIDFDSRMVLDQVQIDLRHLSLDPKIIGKFTTLRMFLNELVPAYSKVYLRLHPEKRK